MTITGHALQIESAFVYGQRVRVAPGTYLIGLTPNAHIVLPDGATGIVRIVYEATRLNPARVLVYLDEACLPNRFAPGSAMVPPADLVVV